jgi:hypothetical protein
MKTKVRLSQGLGAVLVVGGALVAAATGANADTLPVPDEPHLISAVATRCTAPCASGRAGQVTLTWERSRIPAGAPSDTVVLYRQYANGFNIGGPTTIKQTTETVEMSFPICSAVNAPSPECYPARVDALRGDEVMTVVAFAVSGNPDDGTQVTSAASAPSNGLVPTRG